MEKMGGKKKERERALPNPYDHKTKKTKVAFHWGHLHFIVVEDILNMKILF